VAAKKALFVFRIHWHIEALRKMAKVLIVPSICNECVRRGKNYLKGADKGQKKCRVTEPRHGRKCTSDRCPFYLEHVVSSASMTEKQ